MDEVLRDYLHGTGSLDAVRNVQEFEALCQAAERDAAGRLRWKLCRALGLPPWTGQPGRDEYLYACAQLALDRDELLARMCPACRARARSERCTVCGAAMPVENAAFDEKRFEELKRNDPAL